MKPCFQYILNANDVFPHANKLNRLIHTSDSTGFRRRPPALPADSQSVSKSS
jgi:hypothetical protein